MRGTGTELLEAARSVTDDEIEAVMPKVKPDTNAAEILAMLDKA